jgi:hypothetical protein
MSHFPIKGCNFSVICKTTSLMMFNPPLIIVLNHEEIGVPSGASSFDPIANLLCHQQIKNDAR